MFWFDPGGSIGGSDRLAYQLFLVIIHFEADFALGFRAAKIRDGKEQFPVGTLFGDDAQIGCHHISRHPTARVKVGFGAGIVAFIPIVIFSIILFIIFILILCCLVVFIFQTLKISLFHLLFTKHIAGIVLTTVQRIARPEGEFYIVNGTRFRFDDGA